MVAAPQLQCSGRFWGTLDFDPCFQQNILNTLVPLLFLFGSSLIFAISAARKTTRRRRAARKVAALDPASSQFTFEHHHHHHAGRRPSHSRDDYSNRRNPLTRALASILYRLLPWTGPRILPPPSPSRGSAAAAAAAGAGAGPHPAVPSNGPDRHGISSISVRSSSLAQQRQHGSNSSAHASLAAGEVYRIENGVLLSEVHATPLVRPVSPQTARAQVRAALVKRLLETTASGILVGLSAAALGFRTSWANLAWLAFWIYFTAMLCGYTLLTSHSLWLHKMVLSLAALVIALLNFRTALLAHLALPPTHPEYANSWQVGLHSSQLVFTLLVSGASLLFPYESRPPSKLRAIYQTMQSEQLHASALTTVRTTADGVLVEDAAALLAIAPAHDAAVLDVGQPEAPLSKPAALRAALSSPAASTTMTTGEGLNSVRGLEASTSSAGEAAALATAQGRIDGATTPFPPGLRNSPSAPAAKAESSDSDAKEKDQGPVPPEDRASLLSRAFFSFVTPLVRKHYSEQFSLPAVPELSAENRAASVLACFRSGGSPSGSPAEAVEDAGNETSVGRDEVLPLPGPPKESLSWRLLLYFKKDLIFQFAWAVVQAVFELSPAIGLRLILNWIGTRSRAASGHLEEGEELLPLHMAVTYALAMGVGQMIFSIAASQALMRGRKICINLRAILISEIVTKALRRKDVGGQGKKEGDEEEEGEGGDKKDGKKEDKKDKEVGGDIGEKEGGRATDGQIINLISVDVFRVSEIAAYLHFVAITAPILIILSLYMLWRVLGWSGLAGMSVLVASIPIQTLSARLFLRVQEKLLEATDKRLTLFSEVLSAMKTVKFFAWERNFEARMEATRKHELKMLRNRYLAWIAQFVTFFMTPMLVATVTFTVHTQVLHKPLPAETAFTALALFGIMRAPIDQLPDMIVNVLSALTSVRRIDKFLREEETPKYEQLLGAQQETTSDDPVIGFQDATFSFAEGGPDAVSGGANTAAAPGSGAGGDGEAEPAETFSLKDLNLTFPLGELSIIGGPVGSGKTMMLLSLLGETHQVSGRIFAPCPVARAILPKDPHTGLQESIAYCSQNPWLLSTTIRDNILFGQEMDQERYREVLFACALEVDLVVLEFGDSTECGEAGVTLSGGQKARVALARALYSPARYLYLDDILSAVDAHTAKHLYTHCLKGKLMQGRTVIMVTHAISLCLPGAAFAVALQDGKVAAAGKPADLMAAGVFEEEGAHGSDDENGGKVSDEIVEDVAEELDEEGNAKSGKKTVSSSSSSSSSSSPPAGPKRAVDPEELAKKLSVEKSNKTEEGYAKGSVSLSTYRTYFLSLDPRPWVVFIFWLILLAFFFTARISDVTAAAWLRRWASTFEQYKESAWETLSTLTAFAGPSRLSGLAPSNIKALPWNIKHHAQNVSESILTVVGQESIVHESMAYTVPSQFVLLGEDAKFSPSFSSFKASFVSKESGSLDYLKIYVALSLLFVILSLARDIWCYAGSLQASKHVYRRFISALMHATPSFFEKTPHGRIVNRASKDVEALDQEMSGSVLFFSEMVLQTVTIFGIVIWANPFFSIIGVFILVAFFAIGALYLGSARDLKRIESVTRSPIYSLIGEVLSGSVVIRAYADSGRFARHTLRLIDGTNRPFYMLWLANRWLSIRVDSMAALTAVCTALFMILNPRVDAGLAGFTLSYTIQLVDTVLWTVRMYSQVEITANSVERIEEYLNLESEKMGGTEPPAYWPSSTGDIEIDNLSVRYGPEFPRALDGIKLKIKSGQSIAICGRTGSGKSTLSLAFFRFLEAEAGSIIIDGLDIAQVPLRTLRKRLTIIPQDAQLFSGTIRQNLDPFGEYEDSELWMALIKCRLASVNTPMASRAASQPASRPTSRPASIRHSAKPATAAPAASNGKLAAREEPAANGDDESEQSESEIQTINSLDATVESGGKNFSAGQRQLIALARGLLKLRDSRILILDESTANLDSASDAAVQRTIRTEMAPNATVITIAHRLRTLADHDLVAVLGRGKLLEYDTPANLIRDPKSNFYELCQKSGASEFEVLKEMAFAKEAESKEGASAFGSGSAA